jgi:hypothetical protein
LDQAPLPAPATSTNFSILSASGSFQVDVQLPMSKSEDLQNGLKLDNRVTCNLLLTLYANDAQINTLTVKTLKQYGASFSRQMDCYDGGAITIPKFGRYILKVENLADNSRIQPGQLSLIRRENTENAAVLSGVFQLLAVIFGIIAVLMIIYDYVGLGRRKKESEMTKGI